MNDLTEIRMTAAEFGELPETNTPQELIDGVLIVSPPPNIEHSKIVMNIIAIFLGTKARQGGNVHTAPTGVKLDDNNVLEPDVIYLKPNSQCTRSKQYLEGAPDLVAEVLSPSTARRDKREKFNLYEKAGVSEYWLVDPEAEYAEVWQLENAKFTQLGIFAPEDSFQSDALRQTVNCQTIFAE